MIRRVTSKTPVPRLRSVRHQVYRLEYATQARKLCALGATDADLLDFFDVDPKSFNRWKIDHPEFAEAIDTATNEFRERDRRVVDAIYKKAVGFKEHTERRVFDQNDELIKTIVQELYHPPDSACIEFVLKNKLPAEWGNHGTLNGKTAIEFTLNLFEKNISAPKKAALLIEHDHQDNDDEELP
jgi:hypothetical protein